MKHFKLFAASLFAIALTLVIVVGCKKTTQESTSLSKDEQSLTGSKSIAGREENSLMGSSEFCNPEASRSIETGNPGVSKSVAQYSVVYYTDYVSAGVGGMRNVGSGTIALAGVSGSVTKAYLYWHGITNSTTDVGNPITVNATTVTGTNIGVSNDNCWLTNNSQAYRADVTAMVQATGNGNYALSGFGSLNPNGASLIVFFNDGNYTNNRDVVLFDGNDSNVPFAGIAGNPNAPADPVGWNVLLSGINYTSGSANMQLHVADGQTFPDAPLLINTLPFVAGPAIFQGNSVPGGAGPSGNGNLWDIKTYSVTSFLSPGPNNLNMTTGLLTPGDCLGLIVALVDLPTGSAPGFPYCGQNGDKIQVCHNSGPNGPKTLCIDWLGLADHIAHGDKIGPCN
jgi:hypothetical protein